MTKEEKIREAYGIHFNKCSPDENGWSKYQLNENKELISEFAINSVLPCEFNNFRQDNANHIYCIRPVLLQGIENNNGWIDGIPETQGWYFVEYVNKYIEPKEFLDDVDTLNWWNLNVKKHQPVEKPQSSIY